MSTIETPQLEASSEEKEFTWVYVDESLTVGTQRYGSLNEMHSAPLTLNKETAAKFAAAKRRRLPRSTTPLSLD
jgi:hypothetical protein